MTGHDKSHPKSLLLKLEAVVTKYSIEMVEHCSVSWWIVGKVAGVCRRLDDLR